MSKIFTYHQFLNEKYEENPEYRIKEFFIELEKNIHDWFENGTFFANGAVLGDIKRALTHSVEKNLTFEFNDEEFYYQVYVIMSLQDVGEENLDECYIKVKKYDVNSMNLLRTYGEDVQVSDLNEDKILELFSKLDEESGSLNVKQGDVTVSDDDSELEDTSLI